MVTVEPASRGRGGAVGARGGWGLGCRAEPLGSLGFEFWKGCSVGSASAPLELRPRGPRPAPSQHPRFQPPLPCTDVQGVCVCLQPKGDSRRDQDGGRLEGCGGAWRGRCWAGLWEGVSVRAAPPLLPRDLARPTLGPRSGAFGPQGCRVGSPRGWDHGLHRRDGGRGRGRGAGVAAAAEPPGKMETGQAGGWRRETREGCGRADPGPAGSGGGG